MSRWYENEDKDLTGKLISFPTPFGVTKTRGWTIFILIWMSFLLPNHRMILFSNYQQWVLYSQEVIRFKSIVRLGKWEFLLHIIPSESGWSIDWINIHILASRDGMINECVNMRCSSLIYVTSLMFVDEHQYCYFHMQCRQSHRMQIHPWVHLSCGSRGYSICSLIYYSITSISVDEFKVKEETKWRRPCSRLALILRLEVDFFGIPDLIGFINW